MTADGAYVVIEQALGSAPWPNGEPFIHLARMHRERVAQHVVQALAEAGYALTSGPQPWCPECFEASEPDGPWAAPGDRCADEHVLPWVAARSVATDNRSGS